MSGSVLTLILAGGEGERLSVLSQVRAKPGVPFGGKYRIIDFALSNVVNSGLTDVAVLTQYAPRSLIDHIGVGRPWDLDRSHGGVTLLQPYIGRGRTRDWYRGTADAVLQNLEFIADRNPELVLILAGDHVYKMDYRPFIETHRAKQAEITCAVRTVPLEEAHRFGILETDRAGSRHRLRREAAEPDQQPGQHGRLRLLPGRPCARCCRPTASTSARTCCRGWSRRSASVVAYEFKGYWQDVGTVESYWRTSLDLLSDAPGIELNDLGWLIYTRSEERPPARIGPEAKVSRSMVSHGCVIDGHRGAQHPVARRAGGARRGRARLDRDVRHLDRRARRPRSGHRRQGLPHRNGRNGSAHGDDLRPNTLEPERLYAGITLVGKRAIVPPRVTHRPQLPDRPRRAGRRLRAPARLPLRRDGELRWLTQADRRWMPGLPSWAWRWSTAAARRANPAISRDLVLDGERRFDLRVTVAWVDGDWALAVGLLWRTRRWRSRSGSTTACCGPASTTRS